MTYFKEWTVTGIPRGATPHDCNTMQVVGCSQTDDEADSAANAIEWMRKVYPALAQADLTATKATNHEV